MPNEIGPAKTGKRMTEAGRLGNVLAQADLKQLIYRQAIPTLSKEREPK